MADSAEAIERYLHGKGKKLLEAYIRRHGDTLCHLVGGTKVRAAMTLQHSFDWDKFQVVVVETVEFRISFPDEFRKASFDA